MMSTNRIDGRLLLKLAAQVEDLQARVAELEANQRRTAITVARHGTQLEIVGDILGDLDGDELETTTLQ